MKTCQEGVRGGLGEGQEGARRGPGGAQEGAKKQVHIDWQEHYRDSKDMLVTGNYDILLSLLRQITIIRHITITTYYYYDILLLRHIAITTYYDISLYCYYKYALGWVYVGRWALGVGRWGVGALGRWGAGALGRWGAGALMRWGAFGFMFFKLVLLVCWYSVVLTAGGGSKGHICQKSIN